MKEYGKIVLGGIVGLALAAVAYVWLKPAEQYREERLTLLQGIATANATATATQKELGEVREALARVEGKLDAMRR